MVLLAHVSTGEELLREIKKHNIQKWLFVSSDYARLMFYERLIGDSASRVQTGELLSTKVKEFRTPFLNLMAELAEEHASVEWWGLKLAEKNTLDNNLFLNMCYLGIAAELVKAKADENICIISDSWGVIESLDDICDAVIVRPFGAIKARLRSFAKNCIYVAYLFFIQFVTTVFVRMYCRKLTGKDLDKGKRTYLILSYVGESSFGKDGKLHDKYITVLPDWLRERGCEVVFFAKVLDLKPGIISSVKGLGKIFKSIGKSREKLVLEYAYYTLSDYVFLLSTYLKQKRLKFKGISFSGLCLDRLFAEQQRLEILNQSILHYRLGKRMAENGLVPDTYIDSYENMLPERMLRLGVREYLEGTRIVSYQPTPYYPYIMCMYFVGKEFEYAPDKLVCSGKVTMEYMENEGFPRERISLGPSLKNLSLDSLAGERKEQGSGKKRVLVIFPYQSSCAKELLVKVYHAFGSDDEFKILFKPHPFCPKKNLLNLFAENGWKLPANFEFIEGDLLAAAREVECGVLMYSSAGIEFSALGLPYVNVGSELSVPQEPFYFSKPSVHTAAELRGAVERALDESAPEGGLSLRDAIEPLTDEAMEVFL